MDDPLKLSRGDSEHQFAHTIQRGAQNIWYAGAPGQGANLMINARSRGPVLVRTNRLDGPGWLTFENIDLPTEAQDPWTMPPGNMSPDGFELRVTGNTDHWPVWHGLLKADVSGCYGIQVDGTGFSNLIVVLVFPGPIPPG